MDELVFVAQGAAHAALFGIFSLAAAGKTVGCQHGSGAMCAKGALDAGIAVGACLMWWDTAAYLVAVLAAGVAVVGWTREAVRKSKVCNCFGVLTSALEPWRNHARLGMAASAAVLLLAGLRDPAESDHAVVAMLAGSIGALSTLLIGGSYAFARATFVRPGRARAEAGLRPPAMEFLPGTYVGHRGDGSTMALADLLLPGQPLVLLFGSSTCPHCQRIKEDFDPLISRFPFPVALILEDDAGEQAAGHVLFDSSGTLRHALDIRTLPAMLVLDPRTMKAAQAVASGSEAIRRDIVRLLLAGNAPSSKGETQLPRHAAMG